MARKRMISPYIWESESFSELSDFSKLVFISLISHADDEGRGKAKAAFVANMTFPNDENKRVADVKKALSEIALTMSTQFYSVDGREYYALTNWLDYQKIDKPTKSKLPPPPNVGVWGEPRNDGKFDEYSGNTRGVLDEESLPNTIQNKTRQEEENIDVNDNTNNFLVTRTREEWTELIDKRVCLENAKECCIAAYGDDEIYNIILNTLLDLLVAENDMRIGEKVYAFKQIAEAVEYMRPNTFVDIESAFVETDRQTNKFVRKQISNPANYIIAILMAKFKKGDRKQ